MLELRIILFLKVHNNGLSWCHKTFWQSPWPGKNTCPFKYFQYNIETYILLFYFLSKAALYRVFIMFVIFIFKDEVKKVYIIYIYMLRMKTRERTTRMNNRYPIFLSPIHAPSCVLTITGKLTPPKTLRLNLRFLFQIKIFGVSPGFLP